MSSGKTCASCGNEVREGARFCASCGAPLVSADQQPPTVEPPPTASSTRPRRLGWVAVGAVAALLVAGGAVAATLSLTGDDGPSQAELTEAVDDVISDTTETNPFGDTTDTTDIFGDTTETDATGDVGQGVDETCEDLVDFFTLARDADIANGGDSVDDLEELAAAASALASEAPAEPGDSFAADGEPRDSLEGIAEGFETYVSLLSELGLEPGLEALQEASIADAIADVNIEITLGLVPWIDLRCSEEVKAEIAESATG